MAKNKTGIAESSNVVTSLRETPDSKKSNTINRKTIRSKLKDVPETLLWTLHNRANEAKRADRIIQDPKAIEIYERIDYDYERSFGKAEPSHAVRSMLFDKELIQFIKENPEGIIINLGEGLETQRFRIESTKNIWYSIDVFESIEIREQFIKPDEFHKHLPLSAFNKKWIFQIPKDKPVMITAQGLLMYFEEEKVKWLINTIAARFSTAVFMFDTIPRWFSNKTIKGMKKTEYYKTPKMPWGINRNEIRQKLCQWEPRISSIKEIAYQFPRGESKLVFSIAGMIPVLKNMMPTMIKLQFKS